MATADPLTDWITLIQSSDHANRVAIDRTHNIFLLGALIARKPSDVLELGIGSGYVTRTLIHGLRYNGTGTLTSVDNFLDWEGMEPPYVQEFRDAGVTVVSPVAERDFVHAAPTDAYDFLVSDADHRRSGSWVDEHLRIVRHDGFIFFHDTNNPRFKSLRLIEPRIRALGLPHFHFTASTRADERCDRGLLFVINKKHTPAAPVAPHRSWWQRALGRRGRAP